MGSFLFQNLQDTLLLEKKILNDIYKNKILSKSDYDKLLRSLSTVTTIYQNLKIKSKKIRL